MREIVVVVSKTSSEFRFTIAIDENVGTLISIQATVSSSVKDIGTFSTIDLTVTIAFVQVVMTARTTKNFNILNLHDFHWKVSEPDDRCAVVQRTYHASPCYSREVNGIAYLSFTAQIDPVLAQSAT